MIKNVFASYTLVLFFFNSVAFAQGNKIQQALMSVPEPCVPMKAALDAAIIDASKPGDKLKPAQVPNLIAALKNNPVISAEKSAEVHKRTIESKSFTELQENFKTLLAAQCLSQRFSISRALINNIKEPKISAAQKKEIVELMRAQWKSELNSTSIGLTINSNLMLTACENKTEKQFNVECEGLKQFRTKLRESTRSTQRKTLQAMQTFTFFGRLRFYWDKWVMKKELGRNIDGDMLDKYYQIKPVTEILKAEYDEAKILRTEFEQFVK